MAFYPCEKVYHTSASSTNKTSPSAININKQQKKDWLTNIQNIADEVTEIHGYEAVDFILHKYSATTIENLHESSFSTVFNELQGLLITV